jgi:hypothetical protein
MTKSAQKAANIENAFRKATARGLLSRESLLLPGEHEEFEQFAKERRSQLKPKGLSEKFVFDELLWAGWRLKRVQRLQAADPDRASTLDRCAASYARIERRCMRTLKNLQSLVKS